MHLPFRRKCSQGFSPCITHIALLAGALFLSASFQARSAVETWAPAGSANGGSGVWNTSTDNWNGGTTVWTNSNDAIFSGTEGTVTVVNPIADSLTFSASQPYLLQSGTLALSGGSIIVNSDATISSVLTGPTGLFETGTATLTLSGSDNFGNSIVEIGDGTLAIQSGGDVFSATGIAGGVAGLAGTVSVSGSGSKWTNSGVLYLGDSGTGTLTIAADGAVSGSTTYIGFGNGSVGAATVTGSGSKWTNSGDLYVGDPRGFGASATLTVASGGAVSDSNGYIGGAPTATNNSVTVSGGDRGPIRQPFPSGPTLMATLRSPAALCPTSTALSQQINSPLVTSSYPGPAVSGSTAEVSRSVLPVTRRFRSPAGAP